MLIENKNIMLNCILFTAFNAGVLVADWINGGCTTPVGLLEEKALQNVSAGPVAPDTFNFIMPFL